MNAISTLALLAVLGAGGETTLLQFSSQRCTHCQAMQPIVAQMAQQGVAVQVIDVDQQPAAAQQFRINGVPTFVALRGGEEIGRVEGATSYERLAALAAPSGASLVAAPSSGSIAPAPAGQGSPEMARAATVRIKVEDATGYGFGTGTIIDTHDAEALVITCGHLFRESKGQGKITADLFATGAAQSVDGQLISYDLDRDVALISLRVPLTMRAASVAPPGYMVRPGDRVFTIGCDKGTDPSVRQTHITAVNKYKGKPNYTAAGQPIDGRSGGGLFSAEGYLLGICNAADPADDEGLYAGLASVHWQLDQIGQSAVYQRAAKAPVAAAASVAAAPVNAAPANLALSAVPSPLSAAPSVPHLPPTMPTGQTPNVEAASYGAPPARQASLAPVVAAGDDTEIVFIVRSKRDPSQRSEVFVVDQAPPDLVARITYAAQASGEQRAALARAGQAGIRTAAANSLPGMPPVVRGQSSDY